MIDRLLPAAFADLEPLAAEWCLPTEEAQAVKRATTPLERLKKFHKVAFPRLEAMIQHLNQFPNDPAALPEDVRRLFYLATTVMEVSVPIDLGWPQSDIEDVFPMERFEFHPPSRP
jgi:hypothetical protein